MSEETILINSEEAIFCFEREKCNLQLETLHNFKYFGGTSNGKYHGHANYFDRNNNLRATLNYNEGKRVGPFTVYKEDNTVFCFGSYNNDGKIEKISYSDRWGLYTWQSTGKYKCSLRTVPDGIIYRYDVNDEGKAIDTGEKEEKDGNLSKVEFVDGRIKKTKSCASYIVTVALILCGIGVCCYLYLRRKSHVCCNQTLKFTYSPSQISCHVLGADTM